MDVNITISMSILKKLSSMKMDSGQFEMEYQSFGENLCKTKIAASIDQCNRCNILISGSSIKFANDKLNVELYPVILPINEMLNIESLVIDTQTQTDVSYDLDGNSIHVPNDDNMLISSTRNHKKCIKYALVQEARWFEVGDCGIQTDLEGKDVEALLDSFNKRKGSKSLKRYLKVFDEKRNIKRTKRKFRTTKPEPELSGVNTADREGAITLLHMKSGTVNNEQVGTGTNDTNDNSVDLHEQDKEMAHSPSILHVYEVQNPSESEITKNREITKHPESKEWQPVVDVIDTASLSDIDTTVSKMTKPETQLRSTIACQNLIDVTNRDVSIYNEENIDKTMSASRLTFNESEHASSKKCSNVAEVESNSTVTTKDVAVGRNNKKTLRLEKHRLKHLEFTGENEEEPVYAEVEEMSSEETSPKVKTNESQNQTNSEPKECPECGKSVIDIDLHIKRQHQDREISCPDCPKTFKAKANLNRHVNTVHKRVFPFTCNLCNKGFTWKRLFLEHNEVIHKKNEPNQKTFFPRSHVCPVCNKAFKRPIEVKIHHETVHEGLKKFECPICNKKIGKKSHLKVHLLTHSDEKRKPFECPQCGQTFTGKGNMDAHIKFIHDKIYSVTCSHCGKGFRNQKHLEVHLKNQHFVQIVNT